MFACLLLLMVLADASNGHAVLPAFVLGLVMSRHYAEHREEQKRLRVVAFAFLTPFFFLKGGLNVSLGAVVRNLGLLGILLAAKMAPKLGFLYPLAHRADRRHGTFITLLMSTGLTFGTISSLYGLNGDRDPKSLEAIGRELGIARERVRQIEAAALERLAVHRELDAVSDAA